MAAGWGIAILCVANLFLRAAYPHLVAWLPSGLGLGLALLLGPRIIPGIVLGSALGLSIAGVEFTTACVSGVINAIAILLAWAMLSMVRPVDLTHQAIATTGRIVITGIAVFGLAAFLAGPFAVTHLVQHELHITHAVATPQTDAMPAVSLPDAPQHAYHKGWLELLLIDAFGILLMTPLVIWISRSKGDLRKEMHEDWSGATCILAVLVGVALSIYSDYLEKNFGIVHATSLVLPPAVWLALEYGVGYTLIGNFLVFLITGIGTSMGYGPFKDHSAGLPLLTIVIIMTTLLIAASRAERKEAEETIHRLATHDPLTGVANRSAFNKHMEQALYIAERYNRKPALMFIDLNRFKPINDTLGHHAGDLLLIETANRILDCIRGDSVLARFGGDEFVVLIGHVASTDTLVAIARRIAESVSMPCSILNHRCEIECSVGISIYPEDGTSVAELLRKADVAMYQVKSNGSNGYGFYSMAPEVKVKQPLQSPA